MKKLILALSIFMSLAFVNNVDAQQKFGHVNTQELFIKMPEVAALEAQLQRKTKEYQAQVETLYKQYEALVQDVQANESTYTQMVMEQKIKDAQGLQQKIGAIENAAAKELENYQMSQLAPIETKAFEAIQRVARANGYTYIFDSSMGSILIVKPDSDDITNMVKMDLGI